MRATVIWLAPVGGALAFADLVRPHDAAGTACSQPLMIAVVVFAFDQATEGRVPPVLAR